MNMLIVGPDTNAEITRRNCTAPGCRRKIRPGQAVLTAFNRHAPFGKRHQTVHISCVVAMLEHAPAGTTPTDAENERIAEEYAALVAAVGGR